MHNHTVLKDISLSPRNPSMIEARCTLRSTLPSRKNKEKFDFLRQYFNRHVNEGGDGPRASPNASHKPSPTVSTKKLSPKGSLLYRSFVATKSEEPNQNRSEQMTSVTSAGANAKQQMSTSQNLSCLLTATSFSSTISHAELLKAIDETISEKTTIEGKKAYKYQTDQFILCTTETEQLTWQDKEQISVKNRAIIARHGLSFFITALERIYDHGKGLKEFVRTLPATTEIEPSEQADDMLPLSETTPTTPKVLRTLSLLLDDLIFSPYGQSVLTLHPSLHNRALALSAHMVLNDVIKEISQLYHHYELCKKYLDCMLAWLVMHQSNIVQDYLTAEQEMNRKMNKHYSVSLQKLRATQWEELPKRNFVSMAQLPIDPPVSCLSNCTITTKEELAEAFCLESVLAIVPQSEKEEMQATLIENMLKNPKMIYLSDSRSLVEAHEFFQKVETMYKQAKSSYKEFRNKPLIYIHRHQSDKEKQRLKSDPAMLIFDMLKSVRISLREISFLPDIMKALIKHTITILSLRNIVTEEEKEQHLQHLQRAATLNFWHSIPMLLHTIALLCQIEEE